MFSYPMVCIWVDNKLGLAPQVLHCLVHLLGMNNRLIPVLFSTNEESWSGDILNIHER